MEISARPKDICFEIVRSKGETIVLKKIYTAHLSLSTSEEFNEFIHREMSFTTFLNFAKKLRNK